MSFNRHCLNYLVLQPAVNRTHSLQQNVDLLSLQQFPLSLAVVWWLESIQFPTWMSRRDWHVPGQTMGLELAAHTSPLNPVHPAGSQGSAHPVTSARAFPSLPLSCWITLPMPPATAGFQFASCRSQCEHAITSTEKSGGKTGGFYNSSSSVRSESPAAT